MDMQGNGEHKAAEEAAAGGRGVRGPWWPEAESVIPRLQGFDEVVVEEPLVEGLFGARHMTYGVRTEPIEHCVRRRYSDFEWLAQHLARLYTGLLIPPLPPKVMGSGRLEPDSRFVVNHMMLMARFLQACLAVPFLRADVTLLAFLSLADRDQWRAARRRAKEEGELSTEVAEEGQPGLLAWHNILQQEQQEPPQQQQEQALEEFLRYVHRLHMSLTALEERALSASHHGFNHVAALGEVVDLLPEWSAAEPSEDERDAQQQMYRVSGLRGWLNLKRTEWEAMSDALYCGVVARLQSARDMQAMLQRRRRLLQDCHNLRREVRDTELRIDVAARTAGEENPTRFSLSGLFRGEPLQPLSDRLRHIRSKLREKEALAGRLSAALVGEGREMRRFQADHSLQFEEMLNFLTQTQIQHADGVLALWTGEGGRILTATEVPTTEAAAAVAEAATVETRLHEPSAPPLPPPPAATPPAPARRQRSGGPMRRPLMTSSLNNMHRYRYPPTEFTADAWVTLRRRLYRAGDLTEAEKRVPAGVSPVQHAYDLGGFKRVAFLAREIGKAMNRFQEHYGELIRALGNEAGHVVECAVHCVLPRDEALNRGNRGGGDFASLDARITLWYNHVRDTEARDLLTQMNSLRQLRNRAVHTATSTEPLRTRHLPEMAHGIYNIALWVETLLHEEGYGNEPAPAGAAGM